MPGSAVSVRYRTCLAVCKDAKRGALYHKRTPLYDFFRALRGDFLRADDDRHQRCGGDAHQHAGTERVGDRFRAAHLLDDRQTHVSRGGARDGDGLDIADLARDDGQQNDTCLLYTSPSPRD